MRGLILAAALMSAGCGSNADPGGGERDADLRDRWSGEQTAVIGKCELSDTGQPCLGAPDELRMFRALDDGDPVQMVIGPQGARMFVLALRTTEMYPGDPDDPASPDNPDVTIEIFRGGTRLSFYRGRPPFDVDELSQTLTAVGLFVLVGDSPMPLEGVALRAVASIRDRDGVFRWGEITFTAVQ